MQTLLKYAVLHAHARTHGWPACHARRWDGDFLTLQRLVASGCLGRLVELEAHFDRFRYAVKPGWKEQALPGGGILYDLGALARRPPTHIKQLH
jgi:hypothetical protein